MSIGELSRRPADPGKDSRAAPVIVLAYSGSGADQLRSLLSGFPGLTCTASTGIVPLCHQAIAAWQAVDGRTEGAFSPLGVASVRTFSAALITVILARDGGSRWCEFISAPPAAAGTFARLYPETRFLIVHRRAGAVVRAIIDANRWGLSGPEFAPFVAAHPTSSVTALTSYWAAHTTLELEFEQAHPQSCLRVRTEDLTANAAQAMRNIGEFLSADGRGGPPWLTQDEDGNRPAAAGLPVNQIPAPLLAQLNELHRKLGYPPVTAAGA